jgi:hypothetical protein
MISRSVWSQPMDVTLAQHEDNPAPNLDATPKFPY